MKKPPTPQGWAVYEMTGKGNEPAVRAVCEQHAWPQIEKEGAGRCKLIRGGILNEGEAERLARGDAGETRPRIVPGKYYPSVAQ
jgi:hypothetical protein